MKAVVYSTGSSDGMLKWVDHFTAIPTLNEQWQRVRGHYPQVEFVIVTSEGTAPHLVDYDEEKKEIAPEGVRLVVLPRSADTDAYVEAIRGEAPSIAIAASYFGGLIDWETLKDAMIAEGLRSCGIRAVCNSMFAAETFFDKWTTHKVLGEKGFPVAKAVHIPSVYLTVEQNRKDLYANVYLDLAMHRIRQMRFPVIVKDSAGSGSAGLFVAPDADQAMKAIRDRAGTVDLIVEEMLPGEQFGTEIHGTRGNYTVLPPFKFRLNAQGVTDTVNNVKYGPVTDPKYKTDELRAMLRRLAEEMGIEGCAQVDLAFDGNTWSIIEVNPRMSGMTSVTAACESRYPLEVVIESCLEGQVNYDVPEILEKCLFFRSVIHSVEALYRMKDEAHVKYLELGSPVTGTDLVIYGATVVLGGFESYQEMADETERLNGLYPEVVSAQIAESARRIAEGLA